MRSVEAFWDNVERNPLTECWEWTAGRLWNGYGQLKWFDRQRSAHRIAYQLCIGPIPEGLHLDHLCRVRHCVNPDHLEPVTQAENNRRSASNWGEATGGRCKRGHDITNPENVVVTSTKFGKRQCRICIDLNYQERLRQKRLASPYPKVRARA